MERNAFCGKQNYDLDPTHLTQIDGNHSYIDTLRDNYDCIFDDDLYTVTNQISNGMGHVDHIIRIATTLSQDASPQECAEEPKLFRESIMATPSNSPSKDTIPLQKATY